MDGSFDSNKKIGKFLNLLFWFPLLFLHAGEDCGEEYNAMSSIFLAFGIFVPFSLLFLSLKFEWKMSILGINNSELFFLNGTSSNWFLGVILFLVSYVVIALIAHFSFKSIWGDGIL